MPLTDLVRHLNARSTAAHPGGGVPFLAEDGCVSGQFAGRRLESHFLPIVETATGKFHGHAASLRVRGIAADPFLDFEGVFGLVRDEEDFVYLDRLIRTLHALNYLTRPVRGNLLLRVHPRHVLGVAGNHGLAFEEILRPCGLVPDQITLELDVASIREEERFLRAVANYRARGYGIALSGVWASPGLEWVAKIRPDIVRLGPDLVDPGTPLGAVTEPLHALGVRTLMEGASTGRTDAGSVATDIDLIQAYLPDTVQQAWVTEKPLAA